ncbi:hypothetical protein [Skermanella aerolata]|uniref:hypothetical protein n=1 Tax=Skermanella aerolata TaxID=393310 RepID=UPI0011BFCCFF|nr:hypothetical protein [Skermanella aerolata]
MRAESISLTSAEPTDDKAAARYRSDFLGSVEKPWRPSPLPVSEIPAAQQALAAFDAYLRPQDWEDNGRAMRAIAALLSYYRQPDRAPDLEASVAEQWGEDVEDYPLWAVQEACRIWRREPDNRRGPHPGEFRAICEALVSKARQQRDRLRRCLEMPPLLSAPIPLTAEERTALEELRRSERMAELARFEEIKANLLAEGKWPGRTAGPAPTCDTTPTDDAKNIHCPSALTPAACRISGSGEEAFSPGMPNPACPESVGVPASPEQPAATQAEGTASGPWTSDRTPEVTFCGDGGIAEPSDQACLTHQGWLGKPPLSRQQSLYTTQTYEKKPLKQHFEFADTRRMRGDLHSPFSARLFGDDEIDTGLAWKVWPAGDLLPRQVTSGALLPDWVKERGVSVAGSPPPVKRPESRWSFRALLPGHPPMVWPRPGLPICIRGWPLRSSLSRRCRRWNLSSPGRKAEAPPSESPAEDCFLQASAENRPSKGCAPIFRTFVDGVGKGRAGFDRFRPGSMFGSADFRIGDGLTIRRSRRLDFVGIPGRDQDEVESRPPCRDQARIGCPAEVVRQRVRLFSCRNTGYARGRSGWRRAAGKPNLQHLHLEQELGQITRHLGRRIRVGA